MSTTSTVPASSNTPDPGVFSKIKHFFGIVWHGIATGASDAAKIEGEVVTDAQKVEPDLLMAVQVGSLVNPAAGLVAKEIITGAFTALGALTEAFDASKTTLHEVVAEAPEFTQVTVRTEALQQLIALYKTYEVDLEKLKSAFLKQAQDGTPVPAALPASAK